MRDINRKGYLEENCGETDEGEEKKKANFGISISKGDSNTQ